MTASHEDPDICDAWDKFRDAGPLVFWVILEIYGREFNRLNGDGQLTLSWKYFTQKTRKKRTFLHKILTFYHNRNRILCEFSDEFLTISVPKFLELSSNWTKRNKTQGILLPTGAPTEAPTAIEEEVRRRNRIKNKESKSHCEDRNPHVKEFINFYCLSFKEKFQTEPVIQWGKDSRLVKTLLKTITLENMNELLCRFFESEDSFILKSGYTIGVFNSVINKLKIGVSQQDGESLWLQAKEAQDERKRKENVLSINEKASGNFPNKS